MTMRAALTNAHIHQTMQIMTKQQVAEYGSSYKKCKSASKCEFFHPCMKQYACHVQNKDLITEEWLRDINILLLVCIGRLNRNTWDHS